MDVYHGQIVYSKNKDELVEISNPYIVVDNGIIQNIYQELPQEYKNIKLTDFGNSVIIPAFRKLNGNPRLFSCRDESA